MSAVAPRSEEEKLVPTRCPECDTRGPDISASFVGVVRWRCRGCRGRKVYVLARGTETSRSVVSEEEVAGE
jgi:hypothetical protein